MKFEYLGYFFMNDDGQRVHQLTQAMTVIDLRDIYFRLRQGLSLNDRELGDYAIKYIAHPYDIQLSDIPIMEGISNREIIDALWHLAQRCETTLVPEQYRPAVANIARVVGVMKYRKEHGRV